MLQPSSLILNRRHPSILAMVLPVRLLGHLRPLIHSRNINHLPDPTWSVRSLLPSSPASASESIPNISASTLAHLLRLSALSPPADPASLYNHLHFVRSLRSVPTEGVLPLAAIRDTIDVSDKEYSYADVLAAEERLDTGRVGGAGIIDWSPVDLAKRRQGEYFVVDEAVTEELMKPGIDGKI